MRKSYSHTYSHSEEGESMFSSMDAHEKRDLDALLSFWKAITFDPLGMLSSWMVENSHNICSWYGIRCKQYTRTVVAIDLDVDVYVLGRLGVRLKGTLSSSLNNLSLLCHLNLSGNSLMGRIPPEFGHLKALRVLDLSYNAMNGFVSNNSCLGPESI